MTGLAVGITASLVVLTLAQLFHGPTELALAISAPMALFAGMRSILGGALVAKRRILLLEGTLAAQNLVYYGGGILLAILGAATVGRVASIQTLATAMGVLAITPAWILGARATENLTFIRWKQLLTFSVPLLMAGISGMVLQRSDVILLGILRGRDAVGRYAPVLKLVDVANVALIALGSYFVPVATRLVAQKAFVQLRSVYTVIAKWAVVLAAPLLVTLIVEPAPLLTRLFGAPFSQSGNIAVALSLGYCFNIVAGANGLTLVALGKSRQIGVRSVLAVVGNIALNALLIPRFGALGAAIGTSLVYAALNIANSFLIYRAARLHPLRRDFGTVLGVIVAVGVVGYGGTVAFGLRHSIWGSVGVFGLTAIVGPSVAILTATPEERALRRRIVSRLAGPRRRARNP